MSSSSRRAAAWRALGVVFLGGLAPLAAQAERPIFPVQLVPTLSGARDLVAGDFNGDRTPDFAICTGSNPGSVRVVFGDGRGLFPTSTTFAVGKNPVAIAVGDLDASGGVDLAVACATDLRIDIALSAGDGSFTLAAPVPTGTTPGDVSLADVDGDGILDLLFTRITGGAVVAALGTGGGAFAAPQATATLGAKPGKLATADVNGDGHVDLLITRDNEPGLELLHGSGSGTFTAGTLLVTTAVAKSVLAADVTGDGWVDVVCDRGSDLRLFVNDGAGGFPSSLLWAHSNYSPGSTLAAADLDADGDLDVVAGSSSTSSVTVVLNQGGTAVSVSTVAVVYGGDGAQRVALADFDADGLQDLAVVDQNGESNAVSIVRGGVTTVFETPLVASLGLTTTGALAAAELDGVGTIELLLVGNNSTTGQKSLVIASGMPPVVTGSLPLLQATSTGTLWVGDLTGDAVPDAALVDIDSDRIVLLTGLGGAAFEEQPAFYTLVDPVFITGADVDGDGDSDLLTVHRDIGVVAVLVNDGEGHFGPATGWPTGSLPNLVRTGDLDGDGALDLVTSSLASAALSFLLADGSGGYLAPVLLPVGDDARDVQLADLDADGDLDVVSADGDVLRVLLGNGAGAFVAGQTFAAQDSIHIEIGDVDGDGVLDLVNTNGASEGTVSVFLGAGDGSFTLQATCLDVKTGATLLVDLDGDGALDLLHGSAPAVHRNQSQDVPPWKSLAQALAGSDGEPFLHGTGKLVGGLPIALELTHALPGAQAILVLGLSELGAPFKGGVLVPQADLLLPGAAVSADGSLTLSAAWPPGVPAGFSFYCQYWIADAGGPTGFAASNALAGTAH